jgi:hypothetical protein
MATEGVVCVAGVDGEGSRGGQRVAGERVWGWHEAGSGG